MEFTNVYQDEKRAMSYSKLEFPGTYYLAFRDLPQILSEHANGKQALDFGCGAGRSTRFLKKYGFITKGVDISQDMINQAVLFEPEGNYQLINDGELNGIQSDFYDVILSAFTFDNVPTVDKKQSLFNEFFRVLNSDGIMINLVSSPELYLNEWASFSTKDFLTNKTAKSGDKVYTIMLDVEDSRPVDDILFPLEDYKKVYFSANFQYVKSYHPLAFTNEPFKWINETGIAPWRIDVIKKIGV